MASPSLSIVIPSRFRTDLLRRCLTSLQEHAPADTEIIVVDDGSAGALVSAIAREHGQIRCIRFDRTRGFCVAANAGFAAATADIVELLNDDTVVTRGWANAACAHFADPTVAAVAPLVLLAPPSQCDNSTPMTPRIDSAGDRYYAGGVAGKRGHGEPLGAPYLEARPVFGASGCAAFYRRAIVQQLGGFPEDFGAYFEDVDLSFRLQRAGYQVIYEPGVRVHHAGAASHGTTSRRLLEQQSCNEERVFWRNVPTRSLPAALPRHVAVMAGKAWRRWHERRLLPFLCGRLRAFGELGALLRHRRQLATMARAVDWTQWHVEDRFWHEPPIIRSEAPSPSPTSTEVLP
jgi:GT2 family glycosyltransferase